MEYKAFQFQLENYKAIGNGMVEGLASTFGNEDFDGDIILRGAFRQSLKERDPKFFAQHNSNRVIGIISEAKETKEGLKIKAEFANTQDAQEMRELVSMGAIDSFSIGFIIDEKDHDKTGTRIIKKVSLFEVSLVTFPANDQAIVSAVKAADNLPIASKNRRWDANEATRRVKEFTDSSDYPSEDYKKGFLYHDSDNDDDFKSYALPFVDVVDDELMAIPRGLLAACAALKGAKGGIELKSMERDKIERILEKYFDRMGFDFPLEKGISDPILSVRDYERFLRDSGVLSREAAVKAASDEFARGERESDVTELLVKFDTIINLLKGNENDRSNREETRGDG